MTKDCREPFCEHAEDDCELHGTNDDRKRIDSESSSAGSSCSGEDDDVAFQRMEPIDFDDMRRFARANFDSITEDDDAPIMDVPSSGLFSVAMNLNKKKKQTALQAAAKARAKANWKRLLKASQKKSDPWAKFHLDELEVENAVRYRYSALKKTWKEEKVVVKMEKMPFGKGAMRECFRMKKLSNFSQNQDWTRDCNNYVAKQYMDHVERETYFDDVKLQMDAKLWSEEYNRHCPPKPVDIFQMAVLEFPEREGQPLFHVEHFIEGEYIKYNSNSGFVDNAICRNTPHAFSHFTFERSGHELIVVDIQGVGDLYTDPQIHTATGTEYGDGNLGPKGMALFFHSHQCNDICKSLGLSKFDLTTNEKTEITRQRLMSLSSSSLEPSSGESTATKAQMMATRVRGNEVMVSGGGSPGAGGDFFPRRSNSCNAKDMSRPRRRPSDYFSMDSSEPQSAATDTRKSEVNAQGFVFPVPPRHRRTRYSTECSEDSGLDAGAMVGSYQELSFPDLIKQKAKKSSLAGQELDALHSEEESILGLVHLELARYHEICRFVDDGAYDKDAALFHLKCAAESGNITACITLAKIYIGMPHDILSEVEIDDGDSEALREQKAFAYFEEAAHMGDRASMVFVARALDTGNNLGNPANKSWRLAIDWYEKICSQDLEEDGVGDMDGGFDDARYLLLARQAEMWLQGSPEGDLKADPSRAGDLYNEAAEAAMAAMKGKLANKYYMYAEEAYGQVEEEE